VRLFLAVILALFWDAYAASIVLIAWRVADK
jgi:hypothetical protein